jgi:hypothetical protein
MKPRTKSLTAQTSAIDDGHGEITITTPAVDLMNDRVDPMGMETATYLGGAAAVFVSHDYTRLPVARTVALDKGPRGVRARFKWIENDPQAALVRNAFDQGALAASVGLIVDDATPNEFGGWDITASRLTEFSLTGHPANPSCVRMYKALRPFMTRHRANCPHAASGCPSTPEQPIEDCKGVDGACPMRGENASEGEPLMTPLDPSRPVPAGDVLVVRGVGRIPAKTFARALAEAIGQVVHERVGAAVMQVTGRIPDDPPALSSIPDDAVLRIDPDMLRAAIQDVVRETVRARVARAVTEVTGRID